MNYVYGRYVDLKQNLELSHFSKTVKYHLCTRIIEKLAHEHVHWRVKFIISLAVNIERRPRPLSQSASCSRAVYRVMLNIQVIPACLEYHQKLVTGSRTKQKMSASHLAQFDSTAVARTARLARIARR